jgi:chromosomal replication initiator protein
VTDIQPPDLETRIAILQNKSAEENLIVPPDVLTRIATVFTLNIRELEGALVTLLAYAKLTEKRITRDLAEEVLRDLMGRERLQPPSVEAILRVVAEHFDVRLTDLRGRSRQRQISYPRQIAMYLCKSLIHGISFKDIAAEFGGKDHSTVIYSVQKIDEELKGNAQSHQLIALLTRKLHGQ